MKNSIENHDTKNQIMQANQVGFKQKEGTIENSYIEQNMFQYNKHLYCAFLDLQKAYDSVWRRALLQKLERKYKASDDTMNWLNMEYKDTRSCTKVGNCLSTTLKAHHGLQQGALSSPILFNYYINDLIGELNKQKNTGATINTLTMNNLLFADDMMLVKNTPRELQQLLNTCGK